MTKTFTLFFLLLGNLFFSIAKNNLHIVEINPVAFDNTAAKTSSATTAFRFENTDYLVSNQYLGIFIRFIRQIGFPEMHHFAYFRHLY